MTFPGDSSYFHKILSWNILIKSSKANTFLKHKWTVLLIYIKLNIVFNYYRYMENYLYALYTYTM